MEHTKIHEFLGLKYLAPFDRQEITKVVPFHPSIVGLARQQFMILDDS